MSNDFIPIMLDIPESFETERLLVRALRPGDGKEMNEAIRESLDELKPWMPFAQSMPAVEETEQYVRESQVAYLKRTTLNMEVFRKEDGRFVGNIGLHHVDWDCRQFEIGYWIRSSCSGKGYMTEAVNGITDFAIRELGASRIEIRCSALTGEARLSRSVPDLHWMVFCAKAPVSRTGSSMTARYMPRCGVLNSKEELMM